MCKVKCNVNLARISGGEVECHFGVSCRSTLPTNMAIFTMLWHWQVRPPTSGQIRSILQLITLTGPYQTWYLTALLSHSRDLFFFCFFLPTRGCFAQFTPPPSQTDCSSSPTTVISAHQNIQEQRLASLASRDGPAHPCLRTYSVRLQADNMSRIQNR